MAGHLMLSLRLRGPEGAPTPVARGWTVGQALAWARGVTAPHPDEVVAIEKAYSLAALFHDAGHLLFSCEIEPVGRMGRDSPCRDLLQGPVDSLREAGRRLSAICLEDVGLSGDGPAAGDRRPDYFRGDSQMTEALRERFEAECSREGPHHALLGAWYLHRSRPSPVDPSHAMAVRAVLLHDVVGIPIDSGREPVAALLLLCNEIFEWDRTRHPGRSPAAGNLNVMATALTPREPRDRWIAIPALRVRPAARGGAPEVVLELGGEEALAWPAVRMMLQRPEPHDGPVFRVWIRKAQSLGRLQPTGAGWSPRLEIRSSVGMGLHPHDTRSLLLEAIDSTGGVRGLGGLREWLQEGDLRFRRIDEDGRRFEEVTLGRPTGALDAIGDEHLTALEKAARRALARHMGGP
jgi:hypothetical protein